MNAQSFVNVLACVFVVCVCVCEREREVVHEYMPEMNGWIHLFVSLA
jgi:hypothetical protein